MSFKKCVKCACDFNYNSTFKINKINYIFFFNVDIFMCIQESTRKKGNKIYKTVSLTKLGKKVGKKQ